MPAVDLVPDDLTGSIKGDCSTRITVDKDDTAIKPFPGYNGGIYDRYPAKNERCQNYATRKVSSSN